MKNLRAALLLLACVGLLLALPGCTRIINGHKGCEARVANPAKRQACHACLNRGQRWSYEPDRAIGRRCVRR